MTVSPVASASFATKCVPSGSHCVAPGHEGQIGPDGMCRVMRAFVRDTKLCGLCRKRPVMTKAARVLNPIFLVGLIRGVVVPPTMKFNLDRARAYNAAIELYSQGFCEECIALVEPHINVEASPGKVEFKSGTRVPMFLGPEELKNAWTALLPGAAKVAERAKGGARLTFGRVKGYGKDQLTECVVHRNAESACLCGGWHTADEMPTLTQGKDRHFAFGPLCAEAVKRAGYQLGATMAEQMAAIHANRFAEMLEERAWEKERREQLAHSGVFVDARGREFLGSDAIDQALVDKRNRDIDKARELQSQGRHVPAALQRLLDEEAGTTEVEIPRARPQKKAKESKVLTPEEQLERLAKKAADRKARQKEQLARRKDPNYGAMKSAPAQKQNQPKDKNKSKGRRGENAA
jgi:hypothetical protein